MSGIIDEVTEGLFRTMAIYVHMGGHLVGRARLSGGRGVMGRGERVGPPA